MPRNMTKFLFLYLVPLIPAMLLHYFFKTSTATFAYKSVATFGGPVATYAFLVVLGLKVLKDDLDYKLCLICKKLKGKWKIVSSYIDQDGNNISKNGDASVSADGNHIIVNGSWLRGETNNVVGRWSADEIMISDKKIVLIFDVPSPSGEDYNGVMYLTIHRNAEGEISSLGGTWGVLGMTMRGMTNWTRITE